MKSVTLSRARLLSGLPQDILLAVRFVLHGAGMLLGGLWDAAACVWMEWKARRA